MTNPSTNEMPESAEPISLSIVEAVADAEGVDPAELDPPLATVVDPTAIDRLFSRSRADSSGVERLSLTYRGYRVAIESDGEVHLE